MRTKNTPAQAGLFMKTNLYDGMTRHDICKSIANEQGIKYGFTDKDWAWTNEYTEAQKRSDQELVRFCKNEYGEETPKLDATITKLKSILAFDAKPRNEKARALQEVIVWTDKDILRDALKAISSELI